MSLQLEGDTLPLHNPRHHPCKHHWFALVCEGMCPPQLLWGLVQKRGTTNRNAFLFASPQIRGGAINIKACNKSRESIVRATAEAACAAWPSSIARGGGCACACGARDPTRSQHAQTVCARGQHAPTCSSRHAHRPFCEKIFSPPATAIEVTCGIYTGGGRAVIFLA